MWQVHELAIAKMSEVAPGPAAARSTTTLALGGFGHALDSKRMTVGFRNLTEKMRAGLAKLAKLRASVSEPLQFVQLFIGATAWYRNIAIEEERRQFHVVGAAGALQSRPSEGHNICCCRR